MGKPRGPSRYGPYDRVRGFVIQSFLASVDFTISRIIAVRGSILNSVAWKLEPSKELLGHILERVEVTGTMLRTPPDPDINRPAGRDVAASYRLRVKAIRKLAGDCS